jgi:hypothetical protein
LIMRNCRSRRGNNHHTGFLAGVTNDPEAEH